MKKDRLVQLLLLLTNVGALFTVRAPVLLFSATLLVHYFLRHLFGRDRIGFVFLPSRMSINIIIYDCMSYLISKLCNLSSAGARAIDACAQ